MRATILFALCIAFLIPGARASQAALEPAARAQGGAGQAQAEAGVREAERLRAQALSQGDIDALRRLIGGDYYHVESNGRVRTKAEFLQALARDEYRIRNYGVEEMEIRLVGDGATAIVTGTYRTVPMDQPAVTLRGRYVRIWTRHAEGWRVALHQGTQIRPVGANTLEPRPQAMQ